MKNNITTTLIHYGTRKIDFNKIQPCRNSTYEDGLVDKPRGGFWACQIDVKYSWKNYVKENWKERKRTLRKHVKFVFSGSVYEIKGTRDVRTIIKKYGVYNKHARHYVIDWEELVRQEKVDAIYYELSSFNRMDILYDNHDRFLYSWDCDSFVIFNPDKIYLKEIF